MRPFKDLKHFVKTLKTSALLGTFIGSSLLLSGCQTISIQSQTTQIPLQTKLEHAYSTILIDSQTGKIIDLKTLAQNLQDTDVIFIGEYHGNQASHLLEMQLQSALFELRPQQLLSMEMFNRDQQTILNRYLDNEIGEKYLMNKAPAWPNYAGSYRPMIEFAKEHFIPVIAANASADIVRCIGRYGQGYIDLLPENEKHWLAQSPFENNENYQTKFYDFMDTMRKMDDDHKQSSYAAQLARDNTMAESILNALDEHPGFQLIHVNGSFHSEERLGTVALLQKRRPDLKIAVITPIRVEDPEKPKWSQEDLLKGDFIYLLRPQPEAYRNTAYKRQARQKMFKNSQQKAEACYQPK